MPSKMYIRPLSDVLQEKAKSELNEDPERLANDIKFIRDWLSKQPHLNVDKDDQWLLSFLRSYKFSLPRTTEKLDFYFSIRTLVPEFFEDRDPFSPMIQEVLKRGIFIPVTSVEDGKPGKIIIVWRKTDPKLIPLIDLFRVGLMFFDVLIQENDNFSVCGQEIIYDMKEFPFSYFTQVTPALCKKSMLSLQKAFPTRLKGFWFFHTPSSYEVFINMFRQFLSGKVKDRVKIFGEVGLSEKYNDLVDFPIEYGGKNGHLDEIAATWKTKFESYRDWFLRDQKMKSDESKRTGAPKTSADIFGVEGSFRNLAID